MKIKVRKHKQYYLTQDKYIYCLSVWIKPYAATSWGNWGAIKKCRGSNYVVGVQQRIEAPINGDDTALNAIRFTCSDGEVLISAEKS